MSKVYISFQNMSRREKLPLNMPLWHIPYLEKHRIYELFQELARELIIQQPEDHVLFIKQILLNACLSRDTARVIILSSPRTNCKEIGSQMSKITHQILITEDMLLKTARVESREDLTPPMFSRSFSYLVRDESAYKYGWIAVDCIKTESDAKTILQLGILPTHVLHLIQPFYPNLNEILYCNVPVSWPDYRRRISAIRSIFKEKLMEIFLQDRSINDIVEECSKVIKTRTKLIFIKPRVLLIGPRGSGRKTQAQFLSESLNLVHVDFEFIMCQAWQSDTDIGQQLRDCKDEVCFHSELISQVINKRILKDDCVNNGWVLTGFPYTDKDFRCLDMLDTPPNRVIFLDIDLNICKERVRYKRTNIATGAIIENVQESNEDKDTLQIHPRDTDESIYSEHAFYCQHYGSLKKYCGQTAHVVNADQNQRQVFECILAIVTQAAPQGPPRKEVPDTESKSTTSQSSVCSCISVPTEVQDCFVINI